MGQLGMGKSLKKKGGGHFNKHCVFFFFLWEILLRLQFSIIKQGNLVGTQITQTGARNYPVFDLVLIIQSCNEQCCDMVTQ
jgi:hypothetical protein